MTAPRIDLAELRRLCDKAFQTMDESDCKRLGDASAEALPALLLAVEAAVAFVAEYDRDDPSMDANEIVRLILDIREALAPFRAGEEKGEAK